MNGSSDHHDGPQEHSPAPLRDKLLCAALTVASLTLLGISLALVIADARHHDQKSEGTKKSEATKTHNETKAGHSQKSEGAGQDTPATHGFEINLRPYYVALSLLPLGFSLFWWSRIMKRAKPKPARVLANPAHELGMGFLVGRLCLPPWN